jgi:hypothetical protein
MPQGLEQIHAWLNLDEFLQWLNAQLHGCE